MSLHPKKPFNLQADPDQAPLREKSNADPRHEPKIERKPAPNMAPGGQVGIRLGLPSKAAAQDNIKPFALGEPGEVSKSFKERARSELNVEGNRIEHGGWTRGTIKSMPGYQFYAKAFQVPSHYGIESGVISKLHIRKDGKVVVNYERGWDKRPETPQDRQALQKVREGLGDFPERRLPPPGRDPSPERDDGRER